jgi:hypothetical protein
VGGRIIGVVTITSSRSRPGNRRDASRVASATPRIVATAVAIAATWNDRRSGSQLTARRATPVDWYRANNKI